MKRRGFGFLLVMLILVGGSIGGAFLGGVAVGKNKVEGQGAGQLQSLLSQAQARIGQRTPSEVTPTPAVQSGVQVTPSPQNSGQITPAPQSASQPGPTPSASGLPFAGGAGEGLFGATMGVVEKIEGKTLTLTAAQGSVKVIIGESTAIEKTVAGSLNDIASGQNISAFGSQQSDGSVTATIISIASAAQSPGSTAASGRPGGGLFAGRGVAMGTVDKVEGNTLTVITAEGRIRIVVGDDTSILKTVEASLSDISAGQSVTVQGDRQSDGSFVASSISLNANIGGLRPGR